MHFQCSLRIQRDPTDVADVLSGIVNILVSLQSRLIFKSLFTVNGCEHF